MDNSLDTQSNVSVGSSNSGGGLPTPRPNSSSNHQPSPDVVRIYVPYGLPNSSSTAETTTTSPTTTAIGSYKDDLPRTLPRSLETNRIRIKVHDPDQTPVVENNKPFVFFDSSPELEIDLK